MILASMTEPTRSPCRTALPWLLYVTLAATPALGQGGGLFGDEPTKPRAEPVLELGGMTYLASRGEKNEVVLEAEHAQILPEQDVAHLQVVHAVLDSEGGGNLDMHCDRGTFELESGDFLAEGNVHGVTGGGRRFRTERLRYRHADALVTTEAPVEIRDAAGTYRGTGFRYHVRENRFRLMGGAQVIQGG